MGCTIGAIRCKNGNLLLFKNRDLTTLKKNLPPHIQKGVKFKYLGFGADSTKKNPGVWAGINEKGLVILGADGNSIRDFKGPKYGKGERSWQAYEESLSKTASCKEACSYLIDFHNSNKIGGSGDIILVSDRINSAILEYSFEQWGIEFLSKNQFMVRTNFFNVLKHLRPKPETSDINLSSAIRYKRATKLLSKMGKNATVEDIMKLCQDHSKGKTPFSICRHGKLGEYRTTASAIFEITPKFAKIYYVMNDNPCHQKYKMIKLPLA
ncbi:MAG: carcinine hydrolase/isopenicillin-N N-acyltransferase family protein [Candidatus Levyibacteriota bacterium]